MSTEYNPYDEELYRLNAVKLIKDAKLSKVMLEEIATAYQDEDGWCYSTHDSRTISALRNRMLTTGYPRKVRIPEGVYTTPTHFVNAAHKKLYGETREEKAVRVEREKRARKMAETARRLRARRELTPIFEKMGDLTFISRERYNDGKWTNEHGSIASLLEEFIRDPDKEIKLDIDDLRKLAEAI